MLSVFILFIMDWSKCILCQEITSEALQCPGNLRRSDIEYGVGYRTLERNILQFNELGSLPLPVDIQKLNEGEGIAATLIQNTAKWHKTCRNKFSELKLQRAKKRKSQEEVISSRDPKFTRTSAGAATNYKNCCFFCGGDEDILHQASTFNVDARVRECALQLQDEVLLAKLSAGDLISQEAVYHAKCLAALYNKAERLNIQHSCDKEENINQGIALAQLIAYIEDSRSESPDNIPVFKMADLAQMYSDRLQQLGENLSGRLHSTDLKHRILARVPGLQAHKQGRDVLLAFNEDIAAALKNFTSTRDFDDEALTLVKDAKIIRRDMLNAKNDFIGKFENECQQESVPKSLKSLVGMILGGTDIRSQSNITNSQSTLSISQLLLFNTVKRRRGTGTSSFHSRRREPPMPIYLGLKVHAETRKRTIIDKLYELGLSVSYDRVLEISTDLGNGVCSLFESEGVVCPPKLNKGVFTSAAIDNIDHNPSSVSAQGSFHGTGISMFQHTSPDVTGENREVISIHNNPSKSKRLSQLPEYYTSVQPVILSSNEPKVPVTQEHFDSNTSDDLKEAENLEYRWLAHVRDDLHKEIENDLDLSWAAFHSSRLQPIQEKTVDVSSLMPLFQEEAASVAMVRHAIYIVTQAVNFLNPGQVPILACDQPLFAIAKKIQWNWPLKYGEKKLVVMLGGLHTELAALKATGNWLEDSGWTSALVQAGVTTPGTADSFLKAAHVLRTRHAHQVTAAALYVLMDRAYTEYCQTVPEGEDPDTFQQWRKRMELERPQFQYWSITLEMEINILIFVRSIRDGNFQLYRDACKSLAPWFFALDHPNYARWLSVHIRDMEVLDSELPSVAGEFRKGHFVVKKTPRLFSSIAIDQAHEQNNKLVKGDGGAIGLTESSSQLMRWMLSGPEVSRIINDFELSQELQTSSKEDLRHHEQTKSTQLKFQKQVKELSRTIEEMGNPFLEKSDDLLVLNNRDIMDSRVVGTVRTIENVGKMQYQSFVANRLKEQKTSLFEPIKRNNLPTFRNRPSSKGSSQSKLQIASLKSNCSLFSRLYISCQIRDGDLDSFFRHENQSCPPALSQYGKLRSGTKSDLLSCLEKICPPQVEKPAADVLLLDGAAIVNMIKPGVSKTFEEYSDSVFIPYVRNQPKDVHRVDVVWDRYILGSLKDTARSRRGEGVRRRVRPDTRIPGNWPAFLRIDANKQELFQYLAEQLSTISIEDGEVVSTQEENAVFNHIREDTTNLMPCSHEEADSRLLLHAADASKCGYKKIVIRTVDTDVVVIAVAMFQHLAVDELWVAFGVGKNLRYVSIHGISRNLGNDVSQALIAFHAFTGSDQTSFFTHKGKKSAWEAWALCKEVTPVFKKLSSAPSLSHVRDSMPVIERYVIIMYDRTSTCTEVNKARKDLFTRKGRHIESIPPTHDALLQHTMRSIYQAGHCWGMSLMPSYQMPSPTEWGWTLSTENKFEPLWITIPQASQVCQELLKCGCKSEKGCRGRCKCVKAELPCTALCNCGGNCSRD